MDQLCHWAVGQLFGCSLAALWLLSRVVSKMGFLVFGGRATEVLRSEVLVSTLAPTRFFFFNRNIALSKGEYVSSKSVSIGLRSYLPILKNHMHFQPKVVKRM